MPTFRDFPLHEDLLEAIENVPFKAPMPIQALAIPRIQEGEDVILCAPTGTGKTAAFLIPILDALLDAPPPLRFRPLALVLSPTRELARQVHDHFGPLAAGTRLRAAVLHGGASIAAEDVELGAGAALVVATPGRLLEHLSRGGLRLQALQFLVLDEADRLLDEGFLPEIRRLLDHLPERRQTILCSATMPNAMELFARQMLKEPVRVQVGVIAPRETIREAYYPVVEAQKLALLGAALARESGVEKAIVFVRTRAKAKEVAPLVQQTTGQPTAELHADLSQTERDAAMVAFRSGAVKVLVATDIAARGLDIEALTHVVNYDVPNTPDDYIHRVGRTGRVDNPGAALTFVSPNELALWTRIEAAVRRPIPQRRIDGFPYEFPPEETDSPIFTPHRTRRGAAVLPMPKPGDKRESPFTKSGDLKPEFRAQDFTKPRRNAKKRAEKKMRNKKLPHQRKKSG